MSFTTTQLETLERAIAAGVLTVEHQGTRTTYQDAAAMLKVRDQIRAELEASGAIETTTRRSYASFTKS